jgi:rhomboid protease GluP
MHRAGWFIRVFFRGHFESRWTLHKAWYRFFVETDSPQWTEPPVVLERFERLADARELGLVLAAASLAYGIVREGAEWTVQVEGAQYEKARGEWTAYRNGNPAVVPGPAELPPDPVGGASLASLGMVAFLMVGFAVAQAEGGPEWREAGVLSAVRVWDYGEWWRIFTALTLHADVPHVMSNLATGLLFARWLIPAQGAGVAWLTVLATGAMGNLINVVAYHPVDHRSVGASTAVFGALGLLVGDSLGNLSLSRQGRSVWRWVLPAGAGLSLLAYLGAGGGERERVDVAAHLWGFLVGLPIGGILGRFQIGNRLPVSGQVACGLVALLLLPVAWVWATRAA